MNFPLAAKLMIIAMAINVMAMVYSWHGDFFYGFILNAGLLLWNANSLANLLEKRKAK